MDKAFFRFMWTPAMAVAVAMAGTTMMLCYLTAISAESSGCAGREMLLSYRSNFSDFSGPAFGAVASLVMIVRVRTSQSTPRILANDVPVFEFASIRLTYGVFFIGAILFICVAIIGFMTQYSATRYWAISNYCQLADKSRNTGDLFHKSRPVFGSDFGQQAVASVARMSVSDMRDRSSEGMSTRFSQ